MKTDLATLTFFGAGDARYGIERFTCHDVAAIIGCGIEIVRRKANAGEIAFRYEGQRMLFSEAAVDAYRAAQPRKERKATVTNGRVRALTVNDALPPADERRFN